jgi:hypothetical protein
MQSNLSASIRRRPASWRTRAAIAALALVPLAAFGEDAPNPLNDTFNLALGTFILNTDTTVRFDGSAGQTGTPVDWENSFGKGDSTRFRFDGYWRFAERHKVRALIFSSSRDGSKTLGRDVTWDGVTYPVDGTINGKFSFSIYELAYEYAFLRRDNYEVSGSFGVHYTDLAMSLSGTGSVTNPDTGVVTEGYFKKEGSVGAPLPVIGLRGSWVLPNHFSIDASGQWFGLSIDQYSGNLQDYRVLVNWQPSKWVGLGAGYDLFKVNVDVNKDTFHGKLDWEYKGPMIFYSMSF